MISPEKAEIIGLLCAEGSYNNSTSTYWQYYPDRKKYYLKKNKNTRYIQFANYDKKLLNHFKVLVKEVYDHKLKGSWDRIRIGKREIVRDLLKYTNYGHLKWDVPSEIFDCSKEIKIGFIRGFFDGDGSSSKGIPIFTSINKNALLKISYLLNDIKIENTFNGPYYRKEREPSFNIYIKKVNRDKFFDIIKPISKIKT